MRFMPGRGTPKYGIRVPEDAWNRFGEATTQAGTDRSAVLRAFIAWYLRVPDAKPVRRPE